MSALQHDISIRAMDFRSIVAGCSEAIEHPELIDHREVGNSGARERATGAKRRELRIQHESRGSLAQIDCNALVTMVEAQECGAEPRLGGGHSVARVIAGTRAMDLNDLRSQVAENHAAVKIRDVSGQVDNDDTLQCARRRLDSTRI